MPRVDFSLAATYDEMYQPRLYRRENIGQMTGEHWRLFDFIAPSPAQRIAMVGCAFGWVAEAWLEKYPSLQLFCVDNSPWIQANKGEHAVLPIYEEVPEGMDLIVTEDVMTCLYDEEVMQLVETLRAKANTVHWITQGVRRFDDSGWAGFPHYNWKTIADWRTLLSPDPCLERNVIGA